MWFAQTTIFLLLAILSLQIYSTFLKKELYIDKQATFNPSNLSYYSNNSPQFVTKGNLNSGLDEFIKISTLAVAPPSQGIYVDFTPTPSPTPVPVSIPTSNTLSPVSSSVNNLSGYDIASIAAAGAF